MRIRFVHIALLLSITALVLSLGTAWQVRDADYTDQINDLILQNQALQARLDALTGEKSGPALGTAALTAAAWSDGSGADIVLTLDPVCEQAGDPARLRVQLGTQTVTETQCRWDGRVYTAALAVPAGNGYTYTVTIGSDAQTITSPEDPVYPELVYLSDSLSAYCNLVVSDWYVRDNALTLGPCYAHIQTPLLGADGDLRCTEARLVLKNGDAVLASVPITLTEGGSGSFESEVTGAAFALPALEHGEQMDLWLEATLCDGRSLTACAATWYAMPGGFSMAAG